MSIRLSAAFVALVLLIGACASEESSDSDAAEDTTATPQIIASEAGGDGDGEEGDAGTEGVEAEPTPTPAPQGVVVSPYELVTGDCFNEYTLVDANEVRQEVTTALDCNLAHDGEVYFHLFFPGDANTAFPGESKLSEWSQEQCFAQFAEFVNQVYELSELDIGMILPTLETWTGAGLHRQVTCYVRAWRGGQLQGSMRSTGY